MSKTRIATGRIAQEFRNMEVGDVVCFPIENYVYNTVRVAPSSILVKERMEGWNWKTRIDYDNKCVEVTRTS